MFIQRIKIKNFRSIKELEVKPDNLCALIGPNSSGKTNILKAIDLVLGEGWTTKAKVARELFRDVSKPLIVEITFQEPVAYKYFRNSTEQTTNVQSIKLEMTYEPELSVTTTINNGGTLYYADQFKKSCHFIFIPSERNLASELRVGQWTMLGKLMRLIYENYIAKYQGDEKELKKEFAEKIKPAKDFLEDDFSVEDVTFNKFVETFREFCKQNSAGLANDFNPVLDIYNLNWFYKTLQVHVKESFPDRHFDSEEVGAGMQNLLLISIFQTYAKLMGGKVIFGIEEPEIFLYPQAQRSLYKSFIKLSESTQIFYTTHNPNFVDAGRPNDIFLLRKNKEKGTYPLEKNIYFNSENAKKEHYKIFTQFNNERNELFFANKILLVEGSSDKILFTTLAENKWKIDLDKSGVSIIECGGKGGVAYFIGVCSLVGIDNYYAVWDKDEAMDNNQLLEQTVAENKGFEIDPNLENLLGLPEGDNVNKVKNAHEWALGENKLPSCFAAIQVFLEKDKNEFFPNKEDIELEIRTEHVPF